MKNQYAAESLKKMIEALEIKQADEGQLLREQLINTYENLKPSNILKNVVKEFYSSENLMNEIVSSAVSITSGFITKKLVVGKSNNQVLKLIGLAIQFGITTIVSRKFEALKDTVVQFIDRFLEDKVEKEEIQ